MEPKDKDDKKEPHTTGGQPAPAQKPAKAPSAPTKAQSEIGPITYGGPDGPVAHGAHDPETKAAYGGGHPAKSTIAKTDEDEDDAPEKAKK